MRKIPKIKKTVHPEHFKTTWIPERVNILKRIWIIGVFLIQSILNSIHFVIRDDQEFRFDDMVIVCSNKFGSLHHYQVIENVKKRKLDERLEHSIEAWPLKMPNQTQQKISNAQDWIIAIVAGSQNAERLLQLHNSISINNKLLYFTPYER